MLEIIKIFDEENYPIYVFIKNPRYKDNKAIMAGIMLCVTSTMNDNQISEVEFLYDGSTKFDGCSHFYFNGSDYKNNFEVDSYYHLCGFSNAYNFIIGVSFMYKLAADNLEWHMIDDDGEYNDFIERNKIDERYKVIEENITQESNPYLYDLLSQFIDV